MRYVILLLMIATSLSATAQLYITDTNAYHFEDFDGLDSFGTAAVTLPPGWQFHEWGSAANTAYRAGTGSANASDTYSFGPLRSRDRALGSLASGTITRIVYGTTFVNASGSDINAISVACKGEQWRRGGSGTFDSLRCYFTTVRGSALTDSSNENWTEVPGLLFRSVSTIAGSGAVNGNDSSRVLQAAIPLMLHEGDTLLIRWVDVNAPGSDDGLAIDSLSIRFTNGSIANGNHPRLIGFSPDSNAAGLAPDLSLQLRFDRAVRPGAGTLYVTNTASLDTEIISSGLAQIRDGGRELVYAGLRLVRGEQYRVRFDSSAFDSLGYVSCGLADDRWTFRLASLGTARMEAAAVKMHATADSRIRCEFAGGTVNSCRLRIIDASGGLCYDKRLRCRPGRTLIDPELSGAGCYLAILEAGDQVLRAVICKP